MSDIFSGSLVCMRVSATHRAILFWGVCIPLRSLLTLHALQGGSTALRMFAAVIGYRWYTGLENGNESMFGGPVFWADERVQHGALWSGYAISGDGRFLVADTIFGAVNWLTSKKLI